MAIREDEIAAKAMGINTRNMKLLAFGMGATFGGVSGSMFAAFQGFVSPESFSLNESVMIVAMVVLGGIGHLPGVILGAVLLAALPEVLRYVAGPLQDMSGGRLDSSILRQLLIALPDHGHAGAPRGLWPSPEHGKALRHPCRCPEGHAHEHLNADEQIPPADAVGDARRSAEGSNMTTILKVQGVSKRFGGCRRCPTSASPSNKARSTA